jgi:hypothetical protein
MVKDLWVQRSAEEIGELRQEAEDTLNLGRGGAYPTMTYEDGILETLRWVFEDGDHPYRGGKWRLPE